MPRLILLVLLYSLPLIVAIRPITDPDIWSHLRHGQWMVEQGRVLDADRFSWTRQGERWIAYSWLFEVGVYALYRNFGLPGLVLYTAVLSLAITAALHGLVRSVGTAFTPGCILVASGVSAMVPILMHPRPWLFSILLFVIEMLVLCAVRRFRRTRLLWILPPLFAVWANIHIQFVYGLVVVMLAATEPLIEQVIGRAQALPAERFHFSKMLLTVAACIVATLATPFHVRIYQPVFDAMRHGRGLQYLQEFQTLSFKESADWLLLGITLATTFALGWRKEMRPFPLLSVGAGAVLAFRWARDVWFLVSVALPVLGSCWQGRSDGESTVMKGLGKVVVVTVVAGVAAYLGVTRVAGGRLEAAVAEKYPVAASAIVDQRGYEGALYNHYNWGGYLMWRLPQLPVSIDGRMPLYGTAQIERSIRTWSGDPVWTSDPELSSARVVIGGAKERLVSLLRTDPRFELAYEDNVAAVFVARRRGGD